MSTGLSPTEAATVARFEAAPAAPESLRERVAEAMHKVGCGCGIGAKGVHHDMADAAIAVMRGVQ